jgi:hypothetical protein
MSGLTMFVSSESEYASLSSMMSVSEVADRLEVMQHQECTSYKCKDYMIDDDENCSISTPSSNGPQQDQRNQPVDRECRVKMGEWCYQVVDFCKFRRETVAISMSYLDRFLSTSRPRALKAMNDRKEYQLAAMTSLYVAIKLFEPMTMDPGLLSAISHGCYSEDDIVAMEQEILTALSWKMNGPTAHDFVSHLMALLPTSALNGDESTVMTLHDFSKFQVEIAVCDYDIALQKPSIVALAAILNSAEGIDEKVFSARSRFEFFQCISREGGMNPFSFEVNAARIRLLELFSNNSGYELPQIANLTPIMTKEQDIITDSPKKSKVSRRKSITSNSPVSVAQVCFARCA